VNQNICNFLKFNEVARTIMPRLLLIPPSYLIPCLECNRISKWCSAKMYKTAQTPQKGGWPWLTPSKKPHGVSSTVLASWLYIVFSFWIFLKVNNHLRDQFYHHLHWNKIALENAKVFTHQIKYKTKHGRETTSWIAILCSRHPSIPLGSH
jgi:hypothetical protein